MQRAGTVEKPRTSLVALALLAAALAGGCSSGAAPLDRAGPSYLGAREVAPAVENTAAQPLPHVTSSKVLSAIVFERVTGLPVDPATLIER